MARHPLEQSYLPQAYQDLLIVGLVARFAMIMFVYTVLVSLTTDLLHFLLDEAGKPCYNLHAVQSGVGPQSDIFSYTPRCYYLYHVLKQ